ncbi:GL18333 [Drosophila persimilis]|uniref:GL18333 n=1 Tax=Drosophila persimilis TaxID=7234 RepID=B4H4H7_DROPE|nr:GL18333 [Drosophila persimilis]
MTSEIVDLTGDTDSERSDIYTDTESETSYDSSTDSGYESATDSEDEETPETRRYDPPPPYSRQCPPGSIPLQGGPSELPSYQQSQRGTPPRAPWAPALSYSPMGCRFDDYSRPSDAIPDFHGGITTDEGDSSDEDSSDEDTSRHRTATSNEEPGADEPMETDDGAGTTLRHTPTPEVPELFTAEDVTRWTVAPPDWRPLRKQPPINTRQLQNDDQRHQVTRAFPHSKPSHRPSAVFRVHRRRKVGAAKICNDHQERKSAPRRGSAFVKPADPAIRAYKKTATRTKEQLTQRPGPEYRRSTRHEKTSATK